jgi:hypothetical protein
VSLEIETEGFIADVLSELRDSMIPVVFSIFIFFFMLIDYGIGAIPLLGDIIDVFNLAGAMVLQGDDTEIDLTNGILLVEFIPFVGDLAPSELLVFMKIMLKHNRTLAIIMLIVAAILVVVLLFVFISVVGIIGFGGFLLI